MVAECWTKLKIPYGGLPLEGTSVRIFQPIKDETYGTNAKYIAFGFTRLQLSVVAMYCDGGVEGVEAVPEGEKRPRVQRVEPEYEYDMSFLDEEEKRVARIENERRQAPWRYANWSHGTRKRRWRRHTLITKPRVPALPSAFSFIAVLSFFLSFLLTTFPLLPNFFNLLPAFHKLKCARRWR